MKTKFLVLAALAALAVAGCRRTDVRDFTVVIPGLTAANTNAVAGALRAYAGVDMSSLRFDLDGHSLALRYDSMMIAHKNIEMAIANLGLEANGVTPASIGAVLPAPAGK